VVKLEIVIAMAMVNQWVSDPKKAATLIFRTVSAWQAAAVVQSEQTLDV